MNNDEDERELDEFAAEMAKKLEEKGLLVELSDILFGCLVCGCIMSVAETAAAGGGCIRCGAADHEVGVYDPEAKTISKPILRPASERRVVRMTGTEEEEKP